MEYEELPEEIKKSVSDTLTVIELFGARMLNIPETLKKLAVKSYDIGYSAGYEYATDNPDIRSNY